MKPTRLWMYKMLTGWIPESAAFGFKCSLLRWAGATILPGVTLPRKTLVAAGSVVTKTPTETPKCLVAGYPAVVKKVYAA